MPFLLNITFGGLKIKIITNSSSYVLTIYSTTKKKNEEIFLSKKETTLKIMCFINLFEINKITKYDSGQTKSKLSVVFEIIREGEGITTMCSCSLQYQILIDKRRIFSC